MKRLILVLSLATLTLSGCAQFKEWYYDATPNPASGASAADEQSPYPTRFKNDHYYPL
jgi:PBP1b-binding outer membrane lipoprotein LpoB